MRATPSITLARVDLGESRVERRRHAALDLERMDPSPPRPLSLVIPAAVLTGAARPTQVEEGRTITSLNARDGWDSGELEGAQARRAMLVGPAGMPNGDQRRRPRRTRRTRAATSARPPGSAPRGRGGQGAQDLHGGADDAEHARRDRRRCGWLRRPPRRPRGLEARRPPAGKSCAAWTGDEAGSAVVGHHDGIGGVPHRGSPRARWRGARSAPGDPRAGAGRSAARTRTKPGPARSASTRFGEQTAGDPSGRPHVVGGLVAPMLAASTGAA